MAHEGHVQNEYRSECRACRMGEDFSFVRSVPPPPTRERLQRATRERVNRLMWNEGHTRAMREAATCGVTLQQFAEWAEDARRQVVGRRF